MAGAAGFEPANASIKNWCLTTWLRPNNTEHNIIMNDRHKGENKPSHLSFLLRQEITQRAVARTLHNL